MPATKSTGVFSPATIYIHEDVVAIYLTFFCQSRRIRQLIRLNRTDRGYFWLRVVPVVEEQTAIQLSSWLQYPIYHDVLLYCEELYNSCDVHDS